METFLQIYCFVLLLSMIIAIYLGVRNFKVLPFRLKVIDLCYKYSIEKNIDGHKKFFTKLPSYYKMLFSLKRLRLESYFTKEEINELMNINN